MFRRSIAGREGRPDWVFYEGPPTANGLPGVHHVAARLTKDIACRYKTMTGHRVLRKAGWDTHGLPVERSVEKQLGIQGREAIEAYGLEAFNAKCRESVWACKAEWDEFTERLGYWVDLDDPYITYQDSYIESVWWILSRFAAEGLLYRGHKVVPYCPSCGTPLSSHETASGYRTVEDPSIFVKLKAVDADEHFLTWTTTPWTLPSNVALAVGADHDYVRVRHGDDVLILAEARLGALDAGRRDRGARPLQGPRPARPPLRAAVPAAAGPGRQGSVQDRGGRLRHARQRLGHRPPGAGLRRGRLPGRPAREPGLLQPGRRRRALHRRGAALRRPRRQGSPTGRSSATCARRASLLREESYTHEYPFHDRCGNPLIYYATPSWFIRTSELREKLLAANADIRWAPPEVGSGRFGNWLAGNIDWSLSRNRFWGTPLNVWICDACGGAAPADLPRRPHAADRGGPVAARPAPALRRRPDLPLHARRAARGVMRRTPEVIDCWFDSGAMPFAQYHYPFENRELFESQYPADFISEGIDQTRGWFYTMLVIGTFLTGRSSYKSCLTIELVLDKHGKKMSKSVGNTVDPMALMREHGADALRWYLLTVSPLWTPTRFDAEGVAEARRKLLATLENVYSFFSLYANLDGWDPQRRRPRRPVAARPLGAEPAAQHRRRGPRGPRGAELHAGRQGDRRLRHRRRQQLVRAAVAPPVLAGGDDARQARRVRDPVRRPGRRGAPARADDPVHGRGDLPGAARRRRTLGPPGGLPAERRGADRRAPGVGHGRGAGRRGRGPQPAPGRPDPHPTAAGPAARCTPTTTAPRRCSATGACATSWPRN